MEQDELQIIQEYKAGELSAFGQLYDRYVQALYAFVFYRVSNRQVAEDLTSEVFFKALQAMPKFDPKRASFKTWLFQIARNRVIDYYRTNKPTEDIETAATVPASSNITAELETAEDREYIQKLLGQLPLDQRDLVIMRIWDELSYREIAELTNQNEGTLKVQFSRLTKKLSEMYQAGK